MAIPSISNWLESKDRNYVSGKILYEQYGEKEALKTLFNSGNSSFHHAKLVAALQEINQREAIPPKKIFYHQEPKEDILKPKPVMAYENLPEQIQLIKKNKNQAYALARRLFEMIPFLDSKDARLEAGKELLKNMAFVQDSWQAIDEWQENGKIREIKIKQLEADVSDLSIQDLRKEEKNLGPKISKDKKKLQADNTPKHKLKIENRLNQNIKRLELVRRRLNELI